MDAVAARIEQLDLSSTERLGIMLPNGLDWLRVWWGAGRLGIPIVAVNPALRGETLRQVCSDTELHHVVTLEQLRPRLEQINLDLEIIEPAKLRGSLGDAPHSHEASKPWDTAVINFTSGTTGPSKGVVTTHRHLQEAGSSHWGLTDADITFAHMPLFHTGGMAPAMAAWQAGGSVALRRQFRASRFLDDVRESNATFVVLVGTMASVLFATPERADDGDNPLRSVNMIPVIPDIDAFLKRFGVTELQVMYGMTEVPQALHHAWTGDIPNPAPAGKLNPGFEARIVDENDEAVPDGEVGQLSLRTSRPWIITYEYLNRPDATAAAWRNGWFHTGDMFRRVDGYYFFADRSTDSMRRRGENISSYEVEREVQAFPGIDEVACVGVATEHGDVEVKVFVIVSADHELDHAALIEFLVERLPYFAVPRFIEITESFPLTPTSRIQKDVLRRQPNKPATWDRLEAGITIGRDF
jgi:crotonobetaine/carnitine-CoA ligase